MRFSDLNAAARPILEKIFACAASRRFSDRMLVASFRSWLVLLTGASTLVIGGCAKRETPVEAGIRSQSLLVGNGAEPADLDPHVVTAYSDQNVLMALYEGLTVLDEQTSQPVAAAAERWETSRDGLTWTFHLRANLKWSDGTPLVAADFVQSWRRLL